jgi:catechol 2,3-dioxygenase-like lactoylglutathione lyase family enzyme
VSCCVVADVCRYWVEIVKREPTCGIANYFNLSQTMLRIKDPKKTIPFYEQCGLTLVRSSAHEGGKFTNYFMACLSSTLSSEYTAQVGDAGPESEAAANFSETSPASV